MPKRKFDEIIESKVTTLSNGLQVTNIEIEILMYEYLKKSKQDDFEVEILEMSENDDLPSSGSSVVELTDDEKFNDEIDGW